MKINTAKNLIELKALLEESAKIERDWDADLRIDWTNLPTFGGPDPDDTVGVWSWDADSLLIGTCVDDLAIVPRNYLNEEEEEEDADDEEEVEWELVGCCPLEEVNVEEE